MKQPLDLMTSAGSPDSRPPQTVTAWLAQRIARPAEEASREAKQVAAQCLLDWIGGTLAAVKEPASQILAESLGTLGSGPGLPLIGLEGRLPIRDAVLLHGTMGHLLDYDDVHPLMGHPSAPVMPCVLAVAEEIGATGEEVIAAILTGFDVQIRVGALMGKSGYAKGWHTTGTHGVFGAMAACAYLYRLDLSEVLHAFGIAGTQASGLKSVFGSMTKPLHAGLAAQAGVLAAKLARAGFTSQTDILACAQGYAATQSDDADIARAMADPESCHHIRGTLFKYHASCYLTHSAIEAARDLRERHALHPAMVSRILVDVDPGHLGVCNIAEPATGLEMKFSLRMTVALALAGEDTSAMQVFSDVNARRPDLCTWRDLVEVRPVGAGPPAQVTIMLKDGSSLTMTADVAIPDPDLARQQRRLEEKMRTLAIPVIGHDATEAIVEFCRDLHDRHDTAPLLRLLRP